MSLRLAIDISNHNGPLSADVAACLYANGIGVGVQAIDPPPPFPLTRTRQQLATLVAAGYTPPLVDAYVWWFPLDDGVDPLQRRLDLLEGFGIEEVWLDAEDTAALRLPLDLAIERIERALDAIRRRGFRRGIYTAAWYWNEHLGGTTAFARERLWSVGSKQGSGYGDVPDSLDLAVPYGGWTRAEGIQYTSRGAVCGLDGVDMSVWEDAGMVNEEDVRRIIDEAIRAQVLDPLADWQRRADERHEGLRKLMEAHLAGHDTTGLRDHEHEPGRVSRR